jgi:hypothetical protein
VFRVGEATAFDFSVSRDSFVDLRLQRPDLPVQHLLENFPAQAGVVYRVWGVAGTPLGERTLTIEAVRGDLSGDATCMYRVAAMVPDDGEIDVDLTTNKGCGQNAIFRTGDAIAFDFSVSHDSRVDLVLDGPAGRQIILDDFLARAGVTYRVIGTAGLEGDRTLILDAVAGSRRGHAECEYRVEARDTPGDISIHLRTNKGCGDEAVFRLAEPLFFEFSVARSSFVRFTIEGPGGGQQVLLEDFPAHAGVIYRIHTNLLRTGDFRILLDARIGSAMGHAECSLRVGQ